MSFVVSVKSRTPGRKPRGPLLLSEMDEMTLPSADSLSAAVEQTALLPVEPGVMPLPGTSTSLGLVARDPLSPSHVSRVSVDEQSQLDEEPGELCPEDLGSGNILLITRIL